MKNLIYLVSAFLMLSSCAKEYWHYNPNEGNLQERLDNGESPFDIIDQGVEEYKFYGLFYQGGLIYYLNTTAKFGYVAYIDVENQFRWGCYPSSVTTGDYLGDGPTNTQNILDDCSNPNSAANYCDTLTVHGYNDWFLPSRNGMITLVDVLGDHVPNETDDWNGTGTYHQYKYWSSSQEYTGQAWLVFQSGHPEYEYKNDYFEAIAARKFTHSSSGPYVPVQNRLDGGETPFQIYQDGIGYDSLIGKTYQGGLIFYLDTINGGGMVAGESTLERSGPWGCHGTSISGTVNDMGFGQSNTNVFLAQCWDTQSAIYLCSVINYGGIMGWYCPSKDELILIYETLHETGIHVYSQGTFWSSTQIGSTMAIGYNFITGSSAYNNKNTVSYAIPVRSFN